MEKLIKLQSLIQQVEKFTLSDPEYHSTFMYIDDTEMKIKTCFTSWTIAIYQAFNNAQGIAMYLKDNTEIKVLELRED